MGATVLQSECWPFRRVLATNSPTNGFVAQADTLTRPVGVMVDSADGYIDLGLTANADAIPNNVKLVFYGVGSATNTGSVRIFGVSPIYTAAQSSALSWTHVLLAEYLFTLGAMTGVAGGAVLDTEKYADTIGRTQGNANVSDQFVSPTGNVPAHAVVDAQGFRQIKFVFTTGGSATSVNALYGGI